MRDKQLHSTLINHPFFSDFRREHIAALELCANDARFAASDWIFREHDDANVFYLIIDGSVTLSSFVAQRGHVTIQTLHKHDLLGWSWLFEPAHWHFDARAVTDIKVVQFDAAAVRRMTKRDHEFGYQLMTHFSKIMLQRLQLARRQMLDVFG